MYINLYDNLILCEVETLFEKETFRNMRLIEKSLLILSKSTKSNFMENFMKYILWIN